MAITKSNFYLNYDVSADKVNDAAVDYFLKIFKQDLEKKLEYRINTAPVSEADGHDYEIKNSGYQSFITIGAWQENGLTFKRRSYTESPNSTLASDPLTKEVDYRLYRFHTQFQKLPPALNKNNPVTAVKLRKPLQANEILRVYGTWGFADEPPFDLENLVFAALKYAIKHNESTTNSFLGGETGVSSGIVTSIKEYTTTVNFKSDEKTEDLAREYFTSLLSTSQAQHILSDYIIQFNQQNTVI